MNDLVAEPGPSSEEPSVVGQRLHAVLGGARVVHDLRRYFGIGLPQGAGVFTGGRFEHLAGGGDRRQVANRFTAEDLIAVQTLSVTVPAPVALDLLEGPLGTHLSELLRDIPSDTDLSDADALLVADGSSAHRAWCLLEDQYKVGWVIAGKLLGP
ncbi:DUF6308 family protein [Streptomyces poriferorum]|uniref:DUF6308 family protein n=1 Tax=Streptomyces poriferorum TaxID=2798799 RepID=UPI00273D0383|nr:DUF6308 family protein [Streptomyces sp. Alt1]WLQ53188.1 DUF6308 family protein [Streptomyces sp. Alt1]